MQPELQTTRRANQMTQTSEAAEMREKHLLQDTQSHRVGIECGVTVLRKLGRRESRHIGPLEQT